MKIKQTLLIIASLLFSIATGASLVVFDPSAPTASAYKCEGTPDDYYQFEKGSDFNMGGGDSLKSINGGTSEALKFRWDDAISSCTVTLPDQTKARKSQNADGSPRACGANEVLGKNSSNEWSCAPLKIYQTNDKPVNDDGSPIDGSQIFCSGDGDNYDEESFSCKESGACNLTKTCDYNQVGMHADPTSDCIGNGGIYKKGGSPTCGFSEDSCKAKSLKLKEDKSGCEKQNECDKKYGVNGSSEEYKACMKAMENPNEDCENAKTPALKEACEAGAAAAPESYEGCGEARTVLIKCDENARGVTVLGNVLRIFVNVLSVIIGVAAVGGIAYAATLYAKAEDNSSNVTEARTLIRNIVIGLLVYGFLVAIVNWLVPGGVIG